MIPLIVFIIFALTAYGFIKQRYFPSENTKSDEPFHNVHNDVINNQHMHDQMVHQQQQEHLHDHNQIHHHHSGSDTIHHPSNPQD